MTAHSILGASSAKRWMACPGSVRLCAGIPRKTTPYASEGTAAHTLAETCLRSGEDPAVHMGALIQADGESWQVTAEMVEAVKSYVETVRAAVVDGKLLVETRFDLGFLGQPDMFGTNDAGVIRHCVAGTGTVIEVFDLKYGKGVEVEALDNPQLMYYALGALKEAFDPSDLADWELIGAPEGQVIMHIVQPRICREPKSIGMSIQRLLEWARDELFPAALRTEDPAAPLCAGGHCRFCAALALCPEVRKQAMSSAMIAFKDYEDGQPLPVLDKPFLPSPLALRPDQKARVLELSNILEPWIKAVRESALDDLGAGRDVPGWKLVESRASRTWESEEKAIQFCFSAVRENAYEDPKFKSVAQMEKAFKEAGKDPKALAPLITKKAGVTIAPVSDKRPALKQKALAAFESYNESTPEEDFL